MQTFVLTTEVSPGFYPLWTGSRGGVTIMCATAATLTCGCTGRTVGLRGTGNLGGTVSVAWSSSGVDYYEGIVNSISRYSTGSKGDNFVVVSNGSVITTPTVTVTNLRVRISAGAACSASDQIDVKMCVWTCTNNPGVRPFDFNTYCVTGCTGKVGLV